MIGSLSENQKRPIARSCTGNCAFVSSFLTSEGTMECRDKSRNITLDVTPLHAPLELSRRFVCSTHSQLACSLFKKGVTREMHPYLCIPRVGCQHFHFIRHCGSIGSNPHPPCSEGKHVIINTSGGSFLRVHLKVVESLRLYVSVVGSALGKWQICPCLLRLQLFFSFFF